MVIPDDNPKLNAIVNELRTELAKTVGNYPHAIPVSTDLIEADYWERQHFINKRSKLIGAAICDIIETLIKDNLVPVDELPNVQAVRMWLSKQLN